MMSDSAELTKLIKSMASQIHDPKKGLPQDLFFFVSRLTPMVNVDLLVKNESNETLLTWRHDQFYHGWHVPGGIIRFKEAFKDRILKVGQIEFGATVESDGIPIAVHEKFASDRDIRGHFVSLLFRCILLTPPDEAMKCFDPENPKPTQWMWHRRCPDTLIHQHQVYRKFIDL